MKYLKSIPLSLVLFFIIVPTQSQAQPNPAARVARDIWDKAENLTSTPGSTAYRDTLLWFWDDKARSSWASVRPQRLDRNKNLSGTVAGRRGTQFVSLPVHGKSSLTITIDETGGKGKTSVTVYKVAKNGRQSKVGTKWFNDSDKKKKDNNEKLTFTVNGARNHIITVHIDGESTSRFKYKLRAK